MAAIIGRRPGRIFGNYGTGNYSEFELDGTLVFNGGATGWEDLRFPATNLRVNPLTSLPHFDYTEIGYLFDPASTETLFIIAQLPHSWAAGTDIYPHVHWMPTDTSAGNVLWRVEYKWVNAGGTTPGGWTAADAVAVSDGVALKHQMASFVAVPGTGKTISSLLSIKLSRIGGDVADTYAADALLKEFDIHYTINTVGSREEFTK